jgi:hypothetical protein
MEMTISRYLYVTYMLKGPAVIGFNCCGVAATRHLYNIVFYLAKLNK